MEIAELEAEQRQAPTGAHPLDDLFDRAVGEARGTTNERQGLARPRRSMRSPAVRGRRRRHRSSSTSGGASSKPRAPTRTRSVRRVPWPGPLLVGEVDEHPTATCRRRQRADGRRDVVDRGAGRVHGPHAASSSAPSSRPPSGSTRRRRSSAIASWWPWYAGERQRQVIDGEVAVTDGDHPGAGTFTGAALEVHPWC